MQKPMILAYGAIRGSKLRWHAKGTLENLGFGAVDFRARRQPPSHHCWLARNPGAIMVLQSDIVYLSTLRFCGVWKPRALVAYIGVCPELGPTHLLYCATWIMVNEQCCGK
jgi:hypothetical protein